MTLGGRVLFPGAPLVAARDRRLRSSRSGIVGDLFESLLKRSAGVKDRRR